MKVGILGVLLIIFIVLKLTNLIDWSWWWVLSPFWIPISILFIFCILIYILDAKVSK